MTNREKEILMIIKENPYISQEEISKILNIKRSSVAVHISNLIKKGYLFGRAYVLNPSLQKNVCVIGGCNIDFIAKSFDAINMKDSNPGTLSYSFGGVGKNISENLTRLGISNKFITVFGDDIYSVDIKNYLRDLGVDISSSKFLKNSTMPTYISILDKNNDLFTAISAMDVVKEISVEYISQMIDMIKSYKYIVMDTNLQEDVLEYICKNCKDSKIIIDCVSRKKALKVKKLLKYIYLIKPNIYEAEDICGIEYKKEKDARSIIKYFLESGVKKLFISLGKDGLIFASSEKKGFMKIKENENVVNTSGCGDAALSAILYADITGKDIISTAKLGAVAGFITSMTNDTVSKEISEENILNFGGEYELRKICKN